MSILLQTAP